jgi:hypothetical protein
VVSIQGAICLQKSINKQDSRCYVVRAVNVNFGFFDDKIGEKALLYKSAIKKLFGDISPAEAYLIRHVEQTTSIFYPIDFRALTNCHKSSKSAKNTISRTRTFTVTQGGPAQQIYGSILLRTALNNSTKAHGQFIRKLIL